MNSQTGPMLIITVTIAGLVVASLVGHRMKAGQVVRYTIAWLMIFALAYSLFLFRADLQRVWHRASADLLGSDGPTVVGERTIIRRSNDGHFWTEASIYGHRVRFLIDSGATTTTISADTADALGLAARRPAYPLVIGTANGLANSWPLGDVSIGVGSIDVDGVAIHMLDQRDGINLLGMNWLNRLGHWEVRGDVMTLAP